MMIDERGDGGKDARSIGMVRMKRRAKRDLEKQEYEVEKKGKERKEEYKWR